MNNSFDLLLSELNRLVLLQDYESALSLLKKRLDDFALDYRLHGRVFASADLDQICLKIGEHLLESALLPSEHVALSSLKSTIFVASELHFAGGHTKLLEDYIIALGYKDIKVIVTDPSDNLDRKPIADHFANLGIEIIFSPKYETLLNKLKWLLQILADLKPKQCYLLNHANDPVAVAAMQPILVPNLKFIHHCDHTLTLGIYLPHSQHIDFRTQGYNNCRNKLGINKNVLVPLAATDLGCPVTSKRFLQNGNLHTCTSGGYKFEIPYSFDIVSELPKWLKITNGFHTHIGNLSFSAIDLLRTKLTDLNVSQDRLQIIPFTQSLWSTLVDQNIDLYIDSFPICGARSIVEAMGAGVPVAVHYNYGTPFWSNINSTYQKAFIWRQPSQLDSFLSSITKQTLEQQSHLARTYYIENHHPDRLKAILKELDHKLPSTIEYEHQDFYQTDDLRAYMDHFIPIPIERQHQKEILSQFIAFLRVADIDPIYYFSKALSPSDYHLFENYIAKIKSSSAAIDNLNSAYQILTTEDTIDKERFTKLLYKIAAAKGLNQTKQSFIGPKIKAKLLYQRLKIKYLNLTRQNN